MITLVLGGARSGKSRVAEQLAARLPQPVTYLATALAADDDHLRRIADHRERRDTTWRTVETGAELVAAFRRVTGTALIDSLGTWVAAHDRCAIHVTELTAALVSRAGDTVVVSEEVGLGVHPSSEAGRVFRDALGEVNQAVAEIADDVLLVVAGRVLPLERA
jgi:adenosylcobinamide kinase / adenosylcobinamide-phosphate guanylyltransferase